MASALARTTYASCEIRFAKVLRLAFVGPLWNGGTSVQRLHAFQRVQGLLVMSLDTGERCNDATIVDRVAHKLRRPIDWSDLNGRVRSLAAKMRPDVMFFDNVKVIQHTTLQGLRDEQHVAPVYYTPDNVIAAHNSSRQLEASWRQWSVVFTTKNFNIPDFVARGVRNAHLIGNAFDTDIHRPMDRDEVGPDYERFDVVFAGYIEQERRCAINDLAAKGLQVVVYGDIRQWGHMHPNVTLRPPAYHLDYCRAMHTGKVALCFLRKLNRDVVTTRSIEIPAMGRPMVAERTVEHSSSFEDGREYLGFSSTLELSTAVQTLLANDGLRCLVAARGRQRCVAGGYSTDDRAREMVDVILAATAPNECQRRAIATPTLASTTR